ncbi:hypothetical protein OGAPHI_007048 [Ogataea philodendri]|uniref:Uncharacterized protein n=1 Tax=Ogataea philodendri TaxID=1378263 RepID=A0A9P8NWG0_9ASCO|nr:uncharacterized protein OGAPHI_007048 [Ogataea philodendri]KAH3660462.1 hypothetical protein OGAPHI_007048 [Ogataea philodendri]
MTTAGTTIYSPDQQKGQIQSTNASPLSDMNSDDTSISRNLGDILSPVAKTVAIFHGSEEQMTDDETLTNRAPIDIKVDQNSTIIQEIHDINQRSQETTEQLTLKFHSKAKILIYDHESNCKSIRKLFNSRRNPTDSPLKRINRSISRKLSGFGVNVSTTAVDAPGYLYGSCDRSILKSKININEEQESIRANNCDEVGVEDFLCFFETHERRRMDTEPFLEHFREKQIEKYYENM